MNGRGRLYAVGIFLATTTWFAACQVEGPDGDEGGSGGSAPGPTEQCEAICIPQFPAGEIPYRDLRTCTLCYACADACKASASCEMPVESPLVCSSMFPDCAACVASPCAWAQDPMTTMFSGACAAQATACSMQMPCVSLNNCVTECVQTSVASSTTTGATTSSGATSSGATTSSGM